MHSLPVDSARVDDIRASMETDERMQELKKVILMGWPDKRSDVQGPARQYFGVRDGLIFRGESVVVRNDLRKQILQRIHSTHIGADGSVRRARESIYWPGKSRDINDHTARCDVCRLFNNKQSKETLSSHEVPKRSWAIVGVDIFPFNERNYLITVDYFSGSWEIDLLENVKAKTVINKSLFNYYKAKTVFVLYVRLCSTVFFSFFQEDCG